MQELNQAYQELLFELYRLSYLNWNLISMIAIPVASGI